MSRSSELLVRARELVTQQLSAKSAAHCERVAAAAVELAHRAGVDEADAELAGLLHDYARDVNSEDAPALAAELGVPVTDFEREHPHLMHARIGAAMVRRDLPGVGEAVLSAISAHTVGALPMSDLDKVVYIADTLEPARTYSGVEGLRAVCAAEPLSECFRVVYGRSMRNVLERGRAVHPITAAVSASIERETGRPLFDPVVGR
ncbi:MAG TPA: bis(5'-nucleosyl)-tetraphosphatase (symmetrical) YqeK [Coriobacteriia bacterium]